MSNGTSGDRAAGVTPSSHGTEWSPHPARNHDRTSGAYPSPLLKGDVFTLSRKSTGPRRWGELNLVPGVPVHPDGHVVGADRQDFGQASTRASHGREPHGDVDRLVGVLEAEIRRAAREGAACPGLRLLRASSDRGAVPDMTTLEQQAGSVIRPFTVQISNDALDDLRRRVARTRWPSRELVGDRSQGVQLATMQAVCRYWVSEYEGRRVESRLNALPQFTTEIDGVDIHFVHVQSEHPDALPLIMTHGWPGSVIEMLDAVGPLTDPTAHGGTAEDAFHLVLPSLPGYGLTVRGVGYRMGSG